MLSLRQILDAAAFVLGLWLVISATTLLPAPSILAMVTLTVFGMMVIAFSMWAGTEHSHAAPELLNVILGGLVFISPWVLGFTGLAAASWNCWLVGAGLIMLELFALPPGRFTGTPHHMG